MDIWMPEIDFPKEHGQPSGNDIPCNIMSMLKIRDGKLNWTQVMRSNDLYLGLPYDAVLFTSLQEIVAGWLGLDVGEYVHYCDSLHYYVAQKMTVDKQKSLPRKPEDLRLDKSLSDEVFKGLFERMKELSTCTCIENTVSNILSAKTFPDAYENMLLIMCLYMLFQHHENSELVNRCLEKCSNENYKNLLLAWRKNKLKGNN